MVLSTDRMKQEEFPSCEVGSATGFGWARKFSLSGGANGHAVVTPAGFSQVNAMACALCTQSSNSVMAALLPASASASAAHVFMEALTNTTASSKVLGMWWVAQVMAAVIYN